MKRKRTLSGIRAGLDYKNLNVFGDIVGNFHGHNIPSVDDFNTYLKSYDSCDNLKTLASQNSSNKAPPETSQLLVTDKSNKRARKPKKQVVEEEPAPVVEEVVVRHVSTTIPEPVVPIAPVVHVPPVVIGSIGHFFGRFCEKYPSGTIQYDRFIKLVRVRNR